MRKRIFSYTLLLILLFNCLFPLMSACSTDEQNKLTFESLREIDDHPLYIMYQYGDYGLDYFFKIGLWRPVTETSNQINSTYACTCFAAMGNPQLMFFGRNFDWDKHCVLMLFTFPPNGYASVSFVDLSYLGFYSKSSVLNPDSRQRLLRAPYYPFDGMNEFGLTIGLMSVPSSAPPVDPNKATITSLNAIRLVLDYAKTTAEAISLLEKYNISFRGSPSVHFLIADPTGQSAVIEFVDKKMVVTKNTEPWQVATNFIVYNKSLSTCLASSVRYKRAYQMLEKNKGNISASDAMNLLANVSQSNTVWSAVYNMSNGEIQVAMGKRYKQVKVFNLKEEKEKALPNLKINDKIRK